MAGQSARAPTADRNSPGKIGNALQVPAADTQLEAKPNRTAPWSAPPSAAAMATNIALAGCSPVKIQSGMTWSQTAR